jgi:hypothetical protein
VAHIDMKDATRTVAHPEWYGVGSHIGELVNTVAGRYDLVGLAGPDAGSNSPACFKPLIAEIEVNTDIAFGVGVTPAMIGDIRERTTQYEFPKATGAILHEAFHARFSQWSLADASAALKDDEFTALVLLEESRIEAQGVSLDPRYRVFLRASALEIALADIEEFEGNSAQQLAQMVGLLHGRVIADVLDVDEVGEAIDMVNDSIGQPTVDRFTTILRKFQAHTWHSDLEPVYDLAREWAKIVRELAEERGETKDSGMTDAQKELMKKIMEQLGEAIESVGIRNYSELADQEQDEDWKAEVAERASDSKERSTHEKIATEVFGKGTGPDPSTGTRSTLHETRKPTGAERSAAVIVSRLLEKAKYRERDITEVASVLPPGRLRPKALVQAAALKDRGVFTQVEPWRRKVRKHTEDPNLTVGVMVDISGSMHSAMEPMATTAWVMSEAVRRVQGKTAMVYYGSDVFATLKAGQHLTDVTVYTAPDGTEKFDKAFMALDGSLNLLHGSGARLLVVVSDGEYTSDEVRATRKWINRCAQAGVAVLWLPFDHGRNAQRTLAGADVGLITGALNPTEAASQIGQEAAKLLTKVGKRNA